MPIVSKTNPVRPSRISQHVSMVLGLLSAFAADLARADAPTELEEIVVTARYQIGRAHV